MLQVYVDTSVLAYAIGGPHPEREACRSVVAAVPSGGVELHANVEVIQELLFHRMRRIDVLRAAKQAQAAAAACVLHSFDARVLDLSIDLVLTVPGLRGRDAVHAATALHHGLTTVVSTDAAFDAVPGLTRATPADLAAQLAG